MKDVKFFSVFGARRPQVILQSEASECGLVCVAMVASFHGKQDSLQTLRQRFGTSVRGVGLARVMEIASDMGMVSRPLKLEVESLSELATPCILHWDMTHFVVLVKRVRGGAYINDPGLGYRFATEREIEEKFTGVALELRPSETFVRTEPPPAISVRAMIGRVHGLGRALAAILATSIALQVFVLLGPFFMQWTVDQVLVAGDRPLMVVLAVGFALLLGFQVATGVLRSWMISRLAASMNVQWTTNVFAHLLKLPLDYFEKRHLGDVISRIGAVHSIQKTVTTSFVEAFIDGAMAIALIAAMLIYSPTLALITLASVSVYVALRLLSFALLRRITEGQLNSQARQNSHAIETIRGVQSIRLGTQESTRTAEQASHATDAANDELRLARIRLWFSAANQMTFGLERILVVAFGASLALDGLFTVGMLLAYLAFREQFAGRAATLVDQVMELRMLRLHADRLSDIVMHPPEENDGIPSRDLTGLRSAIELQDVWFRYAEGEPWILKGCSLRIEAGESVAIVGPSGCGKSTLLKVMLGLLKPMRGSILYGGVDIRSIGLRNYRAVCGSVMQDDQLFARTVMENIAFAEGSADAARVERVARAASIHHDISAMPLGYNTLIGDMGISLSGGQKQRVVLARALYRQPQVLFLDEATSHLDVPKERMVNAEIDAMEITRVIVAHRPDTIASANRVLRLHDGRVTESEDPGAPAMERPSGNQEEVAVC